MTESERDEMVDLMYIISSLLGVQMAVAITTQSFTGVVNGIGPESLNEYWAVHRYYQLKEKALGRDVHMKTDAKGNVIMITISNPGGLWVEL